MDKKAVVERLFELHELEDDLCEIFYEYKSDIWDTNPVFRSLNHDMYSAIDVDTTSSGADCVCWLLDALEYEEKAMDVETTKLLLMLALNRELTQKECIIAESAFELSILGTRDEKIKELFQTHFLAENGIQYEHLIPVQLSLFMIFGKQDMIPLCKDLMVRLNKLYETLELLNHYLFFAR